MSRAFVKEDAAQPDEDPPERPVSDLPNYVTRRGLKQLEDWEARLIAEHAAAKSDPDGKKRKKIVERDLRYVRARLQTAIPVEVAPPGEVRFGARVTLRATSGTDRVLRIVGEDEAEAGGNISWASPFAQALLGAKSGQLLDWQGEHLTVLTVEYEP
jgi:transcription elongation GreA/GreB family factor